MEEKKILIISRYEGRVDCAGCCASTGVANGDERYHQEVVDSCEEAVEYLAKMTHRLTELYEAGVHIIATSFDSIIAATHVYQMTCTDDAPGTFYGGSAEDAVLAQSIRKEAEARLVSLKEEEEKKRYEEAQARKARRAKMDHEANLVEFERLKKLLNK